MFGGVTGGAGSVGAQGKQWMGYLSDDLRAFGIKAKQWTIVAAKDGGKCRKTEEQGAKRFMAKLIATDKTRAGLRHAVVHVRR